MATPQQKVAAYIHSISRGAVNLSPRQIDDLIELATSNDRYLIRKYKYNYRSGGYEALEQIQVLEEQANRIIAKVPAKGQPEKWFRYDVFNAQGSHVTTLYSLNPHLFN